MLLLAALLLAFALVVSIDFLLLVDVGRVFKETPLVRNRHFRDVSQDKVLLLAGVVENASEVDLGGQDLQVREANLSREWHEVLVRMTFMRDHKLAVDGVRDSVLLRAGIELDSNGVLVVLLQSECLNGAAEGRFNLQAEGRLQGASVLDR